MARLELRLMLQALLKRTRQIELTGKVERLRSNFLAGIKHMPVRFTDSPRPLDHAPLRPLVRRSLIAAGIWR